MTKYPMERATCPHEHIGKEYLGGMDTGDKVCNDCGEMFTPAEYRALRNGEGHERR